MNFIVLELYIKNCIRFLNKGTTEIHYTPKKELQLILGSNGYGKSSLAEMACPLPPNKKSFISGGIYRLKSSYNGDIYLLEAEFSASAKYSFSINGGPNLNDGRTFTVQKALVEKYFGYTQEVHDLIRGKIDFVKMSPSQRKEWLLKLCPYDLSYAVKIEKEANRQIGQLNGVVKKTKEKLIRAQSELISQTELDEIQSSLDLRMLQLDEFSLFINNQARWDYSDEDQLCTIGETMQQEISTIRTKGTRIYKLLRDFYSTPPEVKQANPEIQVKVDKELTSSKLSETKARLKALYEEQLNLENMLRSSDLDADITDDELTSRVSRIDSDLNLIHPNMDLLEYDSPKILTQQLIEVAPLFENFLSRLPINLNREEYSSTVMKKIEETLAEQNHNLAKLKSTRHGYQHRAEFIVQQSTTDCPECNFTFIPGVKPEEKDQLDKLISEIDQAIDVLEVEIKANEDARLGQDEYRSLMYEFQGITRDYPRLTMLWGPCHEDLRMYNAPSTLSGIAGKLINDFYGVIRYKELHEERQRYATIIENRALSKSANHQAIKDRLHVLIGQLESLISEHSLLESRLASLQTAESLFKDISVAVNNLSAAWETHEQKMLTKAKSEQAEVVNININQIKFAMVNLQDRLNGNAAKKAVVDSLEKMIDEMIEEVRILGLISKLLSPTDGFIAKMMDKFITEFVGVMNSIAKHIWSHTFVIYRCGVDKNGLDFLFPVLANALNNKAADIAHGSDGEIEFVNFLATMAARSYWKLTSFPMQLDELGKYFTEKHRLNLYNYVKSLIESGAVSQVFVISHFPSTHNTLVNADFNYLDPTGLTVPPGANQNLLLK